MLYSVQVQHPNDINITIYDATLPYMALTLCNVHVSNVPMHQNVLLSWTICQVLCSFSSQFAGCYLPWVKFLLITRCKILVRVLHGVKSSEQCFKSDTCRCIVLRVLGH